MLAERTPPDMHSAKRVSDNAMTCLDHIANQILGARDDRKVENTYASSPLEAQLNVFCGIMATPETRAERHALISVGRGPGVLPTVRALQTAAVATAIKLEKLLNKISIVNVAGGVVGLIMADIVLL